jgi:thioredoxin-dependent peroxiredoxin
MFFERLGLGKAASFTAGLILSVACFAGPAGMPGALAAGNENTKALVEGMTAPDWTLTDQDGKQVKLSDFKNKKNVVVFFYYKDDTPVCTKESCSFRDSYEKFKIANAEVFGVSSDPQESHAKFKQKNNLPYDLLTDKDSAVRKSWGVPSDNGMPGRYTYVLDKKGTVKKIYSGGMFESNKHVVEALKSLGDFGVSAY